MSKQRRMPLWERIQAVASEEPVSFHVPGHKNGQVLPHESWEVFRDVMRYDLTELPGLDDLHQAEDVIAEAETLAREFFDSRETFFLVNGSTVGNLAMILQSVAMGDYILVPKNVHKSVIHGLELSGAHPIFIEPDYDASLNRAMFPRLADVRQAFNTYPIKAMIITYPDYYGTTGDLASIITCVHEHSALMLVDEAHGVHFSLNHRDLPPSSLSLGADFVVQSAHKMAPALTQTAYLHIGKGYQGDTRQIKRYLDMLQSSSPSYLLMASLDASRAFLASLTRHDLDHVLASVKDIRAVLSTLNSVILIASNTQTDPLKITLMVRPGYTTNAIETALRSHSIYLEFITDQHLLFVHGLAPFTELEKLQQAVTDLNRTLKKEAKHDTMKVVRKKVRQPLTELALDYQTLKACQAIFVALDDAIDCIAFESIVPYPPGIPLVLKGERITREKIEEIKQLIAAQVNFQNQAISEGVFVVKEIE
ncbi:MAG: aminotransferase class I/II-fold pyridoxal phosphate-dependent enzyme [Bacillota bacterium]